MNGYEDILNLDGAILIDKPAGITSAAALRRLKHQFKFSKIGHAGTLDPMATGLLIVLIGKATKLQSLFIESDKAYSGVIRIGIRTDTDDICGNVVKQDKELRFLSEHTAEYCLEQIRKKFSGAQFQRPPDVSAIKVDGKASYKRARKGEQVQLQEREVRIEFDLLEFDMQSENDLQNVRYLDLKYELTCSKGTYVRSLARDIGEYFASCACLASIHRSKSGDFSIRQAVALDEICGGSLEFLVERTISISQLLSGVPRLTLSPENCKKICLGNQEMLKGVDVAKVFSGGTSGLGYLASLYDECGKFYALLEVSGMGEDEADIFFKLRSVLS